MSLVWSYIKAELDRWRRNPWRILLFLAPLLTTVICMGAYQNRVTRHLPVAVIDQDQSGLSRTLVLDLAAAPQISLRVFPDEATAWKALRRAEVRGVVILPQGMDRDIRQGRTASVVFWRDASLISATNQLYATVLTIVTTESARLCASRLMLAGLPMSQAKEMVLPLRSDPRGLDNPNFDYLAFFAPGLYVNFLMMGLLIAGASLLPRDWETRAHPFIEALSRSIPWIVGNMAITLIYYFWYIPHIGAAHAPPLPTAVLSFLIISGCLAFGTVVARLSLTAVLAVQMMLAFATPAFLLSGYTFPEWAFPHILEVGSRPLPFSLFMDSYRGFAGWASDKAWSGLWQLSLWTIIPLIIMAFPAKRMRERPKDRPRPEPSGTFFHAFGTEFKNICFTLGLALMFFVAPVEYFILYGSVFLNKGEEHLPVAVMNAGASALSRSITCDLMASPFLQPIPMSSEQDAQEALRKGEVRAIIELPVNLDERLGRREATQVPLIFSTDRFLAANDIQRAVATVLMSHGTEARTAIFLKRGATIEKAKLAATPLVMDDRPLASPHETYADFLVPILGLLILHQITMTSTAFATAAGAYHVKNIIARILIYTCWLSLWAAIWYLTAMRIMDVPSTIQFWPLACLIVLSLFTACTMGVTAGAILNNPILTLELVPFTSYPFLFISGFSWPREVMPDWIHPLTHLTSCSPLLVGANRAIRLNAGFADLRPEFFNLGWLLLLWGSLCIIVTSIRNRRMRQTA